MRTAATSWPLKRLKDITSKIGSGATPRGGKNGYRAEGISLIRSLNVYDFSFTEENLAFISDEQAAELENVIVQRDDILLNITGASVARCCLTNPKFLPARVNQHVAIVRVRPEVADARFVLYCINSLHFKSRLLALAQGGATREALTKTTIEDFEVCQPPLAIQRRIAGILSVYDELMENTQRRIRILEEMARALYREWFVHFRFPGSVKATSGWSGEVPRGWEVKKLGEVAEEMRRGVSKGELTEPSPYVGLEHIPRRSLALDAWETTIKLGSNKLEFEKGEILFGKIRPYFHKVSVAPFDGLCSADTIVIRARRPEYYAIVVGCVSSDEFVAHATATSNGSKMPRANWNVLKDYAIAIPPAALARRFSALVEANIQQMQALVFQIQNLRRTRDLLLPRLLSGQVELATD